MHGVAVNRAVLAEPGVIHEIGHVDDHGVSFPVANRVAVIGRIESWVVLPAIGGDHAKGVLFRRVDRVVEEDNFIGNLNDFSGRTDARETLGGALKRRVLMTLMLA